MTLFLLNLLSKVGIQEEISSNPRNFDETMQTDNPADRKKSHSIEAG